MQVIHERCAGIDVHKKTVVVCVLLTQSDGTRQQADSHVCDDDGRSAGAG